MKYLVSGGAGYIGSVVSAVLIEAGHDVVVLDDLSTGHADAVPDGAQLVQTSITAASSVLAGGDFDGVLHFAAKSLVAESVGDPALYWNNNVAGTVALLDAVRAADVPRVVFSSSAATYGQPLEVPIDETSPTRPTNPYGASKLAIDLALTDYTAAYGFGAISLRYFNVAGALLAASSLGEQAVAGRSAAREGRGDVVRGDGEHDVAGRSAAREGRGDVVRGVGERHAVETHLIPIALQVAAGQRPALSVFGTDYETADGSCVRDYIHVVDLADAHLRALEACTPGTHQIINLGSGTGYSVYEVADAVRRVTGHDLPVEAHARRAGDPATLIASNELAREVLRWSPQRNLDTMVSDAWAFAQSRR